MGVSRGWIKLLMREGKNSFGGSVLTIGRQDVYATCKNLQKWAKEVNFQLVPDVEISISAKDEFRERQFITDVSLFLSLGFESIDSIDNSDFEQCTIVHDLNKDVPVDLHKRFDVIFDGGSSEHIFNISKVFENYYKMLKIGGRIIHSLPSSNHVDHGFYMFSPTLFSDYYSANKWCIKDILFIKTHINFETKPMKVYEYVPGYLDWFVGCLNGIYGIFFVAQKTIDSTFNASVQQGCYKRKWCIESEESKHLYERNTLLRDKIITRLPTGLKNALKPIGYPMYQILARIKFPLKLIAKY